MIKFCLLMSLIVVLSCGKRYEDKFKYCHLDNFLEDDEKVFKTLDDLNKDDVFNVNGYLTKGICVESSKGNNNGEERFKGSTDDDYWLVSQDI